MIVIDVGKGSFFKRIFYANANFWSTRKSFILNLREKKKELNNT